MAEIEREIAKLPIDDRAKAIYSGDGISKLYPPQATAIASGILDGRNAVVSIPTASGKTMIAEICAIDTILKRRKKVLYLAPLRALASEKYNDFRRLFVLGIRAALSTGDYAYLDNDLGNYDLIVTTNEKADSLFRHQVGWMSEVGLVIADEVHIINDQGRGPALEALLTRVKMLDKEHSMQILCLSATVGNSEEIAHWLDAKLIISTWRPVKLSEGVYYKNVILFPNGKAYSVASEKEPVSDLVADTVRHGASILVFTSSRASAVALAKKLSHTVAPLLNDMEKASLMATSINISTMFKDSSSAKTLCDCIINGAAFHHAGLPYTQRKAVETEFRKAKIKCVVATPTLTAGVNTPARRVLIYDYKRIEEEFGKGSISVLEEKQMAGRAGRPQYDPYGEALILAKTNAERKELMEKYVNSKPENVWSKLGTEHNIRTHILSGVVTGIISSVDTMDVFLSNTFAAHQYGADKIKPAALRALKWLQESKMVTMSEEDIRPTGLGARVSRLYIDPMTANIIYDALPSTSPETEAMSYILLMSITPDMPKSYVTKKEQKELVKFVEKNQHLFLHPPPDSDSMIYAPALAEVKTALVVRDLGSDVSDNIIDERYGIGAGDIHSYLESSEWIGFAMSQIAEATGFFEQASRIDTIVASLHARRSKRK